MVVVYWFVRVPTCCNIVVVLNRIDLMLKYEKEKDRKQVNVSRGFW